jgi:hypothetical protein
MISMQKFVDDFSKEFENRLKEKTNWGRNEIMVAFRIALIETLAKAVSSAEYNPNKESNNA